jgi:hypothetical protein
MASQTWIKVGQQVMRSSDGGTIDGVNYDHVLSIEVDEMGCVVAKSKIGYNNGENICVAQQRFIDASWHCGLHSTMSGKGCSNIGRRRWRRNTTTYHTGGHDRYPHD